MNETVKLASTRFHALGLSFRAKPILIGGMAMQYYGMRKAGADIDLIISNADYLWLADTYPGQRKDIYGDLGVVVEEFEIWRSIALLDYDFFLKDAIEEGDLLVVSIDRLLWMRVCAMGVEKYRKDLELMKEYYHTHFTNQAYLTQARQHENAYAKMHGTVLAGQYDDV